MDLRNKTDSEILSGLKLWVGKEREAASAVLHYLLEVESRKLHLANHSSLFEFCVNEMKYSRHEAQARIDAMRLMKIVPAVDRHIDSGKLSLTVAAQAQSAIRCENERRRKSGEAPVSAQEVNFVLQDLMSSSTREADRKLATHFPQMIQPERTRPVTEEHTRIEFTADAALMKKLEELKRRLSHKTEGGRWDKLFDQLADFALEKFNAPVRRAPGRKRSTVGLSHATEAHHEQSERPANGPYKSASKSNHNSGQPTYGNGQPPSRYIAKHVRREVWSRNENGCDHILENGQRCGSTRDLEIDHLHEFSKGGGHDLENLRLLCGAHNRLRSDRWFQTRKEFMARVEAVRAACVSEILH